MRPIVAARLSADNRNATKGGCGRTSGGCIYRNEWRTTYEEGTPGSWRYSDGILGARPGGANVPSDASRLS